MAPPQATWEGGRHRVDLSGAAADHDRQLSTGPGRMTIGFASGTAVASQPGPIRLMASMLTSSSLYGVPHFFQTRIEEVICGLGAMKVVLKLCRPVGTGARRSCPRAAPPSSSRSSSRSSRRWCSPTGRDSGTCLRRNSVRAHASRPASTECRLRLRSGQRSGRCRRSDPTRMRRTAWC